MLNAVFNTNNYGKIKVLDRGIKPNYYKVEFLNTHNIDEFRKDAILNGQIRDKYATTLCGIGVIGDISTKGKNTKLYTVWRNMISRCYSQTSQNGAYYGKVSVAKEWQTFEYFYQDVKNVPGWNKELFEQGKIVLDKDIKQRYCKHKIYSRQTCMWVSCHKNACIQDSQQRYFQAISPNGVRYTDYNVSKFGREHGLERKQISAVLHGKYKSTMGWKFSYIEKEIV